MFCNKIFFHISCSFFLFDIIKTARNFYLKKCYYILILIINIQYIVFLFLFTVIRLYHMHNGASHPRGSQCARRNAYNKDSRSPSKILFPTPLYFLSPFLFYITIQPFLLFFSLWHKGTLLLSGIGKPNTCLFCSADCVKRSCASPRP